MYQQLRRILDVNPQLELKIEDAISTKGFRDFQHFATVALENQVAWETGNITTEIPNTVHLHINKADTAPPGNLSPKTTFLANEELLSMPTPEPEISYLSIPETTNSILWGQYYRFLPVKVGVRVLLNMSKDHFPERQEFTEKVIKVALPFRHQLAKLDRSDRRSFGELLSASFPTHDEKSVRRFVNHYMLYLRTSDMAILGMMPELKLINITSSESGTIRMGLTKFGGQFAQLQNPAIDMNKPESLSSDEIDFLLNHIADNIPAEFEHMTTALKAIRNGKTNRDDLNAALKEYYSRYHKGTEWSDTVVNTMRSGLIGRLNELGLTRRQKHGKNISYHITDAGEKYIQNLSGNEEIKAGYPQETE